MRVNVCVLGCVFVCVEEGGGGGTVFVRASEYTEWGLGGGVLADTETDRPRHREREERKRERECPFVSQKVCMGPTVRTAIQVYS